MAEELCQVICGGEYSRLGESWNNRRVTECSRKRNTQSIKPGNEEGARGCGVWFKISRLEVPLRYDRKILILKPSGSVHSCPRFEANISITSKDMKELAATLWPNRKDINYFQQGQLSQVNIWRLSWRCHWSRRGSYFRTSTLHICLTTPASVY